jgi:dTDP-4-amino-4,6-dideoxygalactose transaminase
MINHSKPTIEEDDIAAVAAAVASGMLVSGARVAALEETLAADNGYAHAVAVHSCTQALNSVLRAMFPGTRPRVGISAYMCRSLYDGIVLGGGIPVLYDIDPETFSIDPSLVKPGEIDAILIPHLYGTRAPIEDYLSLGIPVIEDMAQRIPPKHLLKSDPKPHVRIYSFEATKLMTSGGEGGVLLSDDSTLVAKLRDYRAPSFYIGAPLSSKITMTEMQAAMGLVQWQKLDRFLMRRREIAAYYLDSLDAAGLGHYVRPGMRKEDTWHFRFVTEVSQPKLFIEKGQQYGVAFRQTMSPSCLHEVFGLAGSYSKAINMQAHDLGLPIYPSLTDADAKQVIYTFKKLVAELR